MNKTFSINIQYNDTLTPSVVEWLGYKHHIPRKAFYRACIVSNKGVQMNCQSATIMEWDEDGNPIELAPADEVLLAFLDYIKKAIENFMVVEVNGRPHSNLYEE